MQQLANTANSKCRKKNDIEDALVQGESAEPLFRAKRVERNRIFHIFAVAASMKQERSWTDHCFLHAANGTHQSINQRHHPLLTGNQINTNKNNSS